MVDISIIVPMYNCNQTILELIESIERQNFNTFEVLLINDGSTDNTLEIVNKKCKSNEKYQVYTQNNMGAPAARNNGIEHARGKYLYFCDADDILDSKCLSSMYSKATSNNLDLVIGQVQHFIPKTKDKDMQYPVFPNRAKLLGKYRYLMCDPIPGTKLYKKELIDRYQIRFSDLKIAQDTNFYLKYLSVADKISEVNEIVYYYRHSSGSISRTYSLNKLLDIKTSIHDILDFIEPIPLKEKDDLISFLEFVKITNYNWQLRKRKHLSDEDFQELRYILCEDVDIKHHINLKKLIAYSIPIIEFTLIKRFNINIKYID